MSKRGSQDVKRQLFQNMAGRKNSNLDTPASNLLSRTLRKNSDKYKKSIEDPEFVIHKSTNSEDYKIFNTAHALSQSKLQALEQAEQAFQEVFHSGYDDSGSEDEEPDVSAIASPVNVNEDNILISVPGYTMEELIVSKRLDLKDQRNIRLSKVSQLDRAFSDKSFMRDMTPGQLQEYDLINQEFLEELKLLKEEKERAKEAPMMPKEHTDHLQPYHIEILRDAIAKIEVDSWRYA